jgi:hypothetical protein
MALQTHDINELYSNANGTIQFIELNVGNFNTVHPWQGWSIIATQGETEHSYTFPRDLPNTQSPTNVLIATQVCRSRGCHARLHCSFRVPLHRRRNRKLSRERARHLHGITDRRHDVLECRRFYRCQLTHELRWQHRDGSGNVFR